ncbi:MAG: hypothetical protein V4732_21820 [Pseudomonadota bacterium]
MDIVDAQKDMCKAYYGGATGALASGLAWLLAALVGFFYSPDKAIVAMYVGGMFIFPVSVVFSKLMGRSGKHSANNPLGKLALESTVLMLVCLPLAFVASLYKMEWFFPALLLIIGGRYLLFSTLYGLITYWAFAISLVVAAIILVMTQASFLMGGFVGAFIEIIFSVFLAIAVRSSVVPVTK